ncbi:iron-sulfur cluster co-chaperone protein HscB [Anopheles aquasalis]|uniref:iron-sulfur cluster co-chaperone protein HscB n=1 Tax=Anopheles aquasalis TaxID=42839 RepID=UPI00215A63E1|nr:iron-sulfur cluster co-chaperone protein HscB [Anopheles aquasalis]XP_050091902.1 iron-sulfur cluster co-chaperone protein HscB [Anopheles aquasalis]XP_050091903.1 iron-sulfur cluster co-chaperone protein HscB [Anopheles aquasalis]
MASCFFRTFPINRGATKSLSFNYFLRYYASCPRCWKCSSEGSKDKFFCSSCGVLLKVAKHENYFALLDVAKRYNVDLVALKKNFRSIQNQIHPDKFAQQTPEEKQLALEWSALINKAYKTLTKSVDRSQYLLELQGITISEDNSHIDQSFLIDMMDLNESIDEARDSEQLQQLKARIENLIQNQTQDIEQSFQADDLERAKQSVIRLKYLINIESKTKAKVLQQSLQTK